MGAAQHAYRRLATLAAKLVSPGGTLFQASCSSRLPKVDFFDLVAEGLAAGDTVITRGNERVRPGQPLQVVE